MNELPTKIALITGSTAGIGRSTAIGLAKQGIQVVIVGRNAEKAQKAVDEVKQASGSDKVDYLVADLSSQKSVRKLAADFKAKYPRLDILVNNAGAVYNTLQYSEDNIEMQVATNHMAPFILTHELLDLLKQSAPARIVNVASHSHYSGRLNFDDLFMTKGYNGLKMYERTKLCNVLFTLELADHLKGTGVTVNVLHPGVVKTQIGNKNGGFLYSLGWSIASLLFGISEAKGAETSIYLASSPEVEGETGKYWAKSKHKWHSRYSQTEGLRDKLWKATEGLIK